MGHLSQILSRFRLWARQLSHRCCYPQRPNFIISQPWFHPPSSTRHNSVECCSIGSA